MKNKIAFELIWWLITAVLVVLILSPIYQALGDRYPYYIPNAILIVVFITFTRWIFLLKYTFFAKMRWVKAFLIFLPIPIFFYAMDALYDFQNILDETGFTDIMSHLSTDSYLKLVKYIKYQFIFFGAGTMVVIIALPVRMIISIWRVYNNKGTV